ncbi:MAG: AAA family ATPase [Gammaproteobacteria bacterium]|nr:AAA family ATPase [Gammaproteobacteria bacterium]MBU1481138.1 AAA family ATPase [Gammaproteobacteria bacterium]
MRSDAHDQAAGLRRLLARSMSRVVTVIGARDGLGATSIVVNLAAVLAHSGKDVLVLDENLSHDNVANTLALKSRYDLLNVVRGDKTWQEVMLRSAQGVRVLPVARAMQSLPKLDETQREQLLESLSAAAKDTDVVLVDAARAGHSVCASLSGDEPLLLVLNATASGITESYALLKQMAMHNGRQAFDIVVNKVGSEREALAVFDNMSLVARVHLQVRLEYLGYIPVDEKLKRATQLGRPVIEAFPAAQASYAMREIAQGLLRAPGAADEGHDALGNVMQRLMRQARPANNRMATLT